MRSWKTTIVLLLVALTLVGVTGCDDDPGDVIPPEPPKPEPLEPISGDGVIPTSMNMILKAGMEDYFRLGRDMYNQGRLRLVPSSDMPADNYNGYWNGVTDEILISEKMLERYPDQLDRATIVMHELIHARYKEITHWGPWWSDQHEFRERWKAASQ